MNIIHLVGRVGRECEIRYFESGTVKSNTSIAVRRQGKNQVPDWINIIAWGRIAEIMSNYAHKGSLIGVKGRVVIEKWNDRNSGEQRSKPTVVVEKLDLLGGRNESNPNQYQNDQGNWS